MAYTAVERVNRSHTFTLKGGIEFHILPYESRPVPRGCEKDPKLIEAEKLGILSLISSADHDEVPRKQPVKRMPFKAGVTATDVPDEFKEGDVSNG